MNGRVERSLLREDRLAVESRLLRLEDAALQEVPVEKVDASDYHIPPEVLSDIKESAIEHLGLPPAELWMGPRCPPLDRGCRIIFFHGTSLEDANDIRRRGGKLNGGGELGQAFYVGSYTTAYRYACSANITTRRAIVVCSLMSDDIAKVGCLTTREEVDAVIERANAGALVAAYATNTPKNLHHQCPRHQIAVYDTKRLMVHGCCEVTQKPEGYWPDSTWFDEVYDLEATLQEWANDPDEDQDDDERDTYFDARHVKTNGYYSKQSRVTVPLYQKRF